MSLNDSNLVKFYDTYNLQRVSKATHATARATADIAASNREIAAYARESLKLDMMRLQVQVRMAEIASESNHELKKISNELNSIGYSIDSMADRISSGLDEVKNSVDYQTSIHKEHYNELKKEKVLKQVLYEMKKFQDNCEKTGDKFQAGFGGKILLSLINIHSFSTKDLSDIKDKEYFDEIMTKSINAWDNLEEKKKQEIDDFEKIYFTYNELSKIPIDKKLKKIFPLKELLSPINISIPPEPTKEEIPKPEILNKYPFIIESMDKIKTFTKKMKLFRTMFIISICVFFMSPFIFSISESNEYEINSKKVNVYKDMNLKKVIVTLNKGDRVKKGKGIENIGNDLFYEIKLNDKTRKGEEISGWVNSNEIEKYHSPESFVISIVSLILFFITFLGTPIILIIRVILRIAFYKKFNIDKGILQRALPDINRYIENRRKVENDYDLKYSKWQEKVSQLQADEKKEMDRVKKLNFEIEKENTIIENKRKMYLETHFKILNELKTSINSFLDQNSYVKQYYPPV